MTAARPDVSLRPLLARAWVPQILSVLAIATLVAVATWALLNSRHAARLEGEQHRSNITLALDGEISRVFSRLDQMLQVTIASLEVPGVDTFDPESRRAIVLNSHAAIASETQLYVTDEAGRVVYNSRSPEPPNFDVSARPQFLAHRGSADVGLFFSEAMNGLSDGHRVITLSRRINHRDGSFAGIAAARVDLGFFDRLFANFNIGTAGVIDLLGADGRLIFQHRNDGREAQYKTPKPIYQELQASPVGTFERVSATDNVSRLYSYRKMEMFPFHVMVGVAASDVFAGWDTNLRILGTVVLLFVAVACWLLIQMVRRTAAQQRAERAVAWAEAERAVALERLETIFFNSRIPSWSPASGASTTSFTRRSTRCGRS